MFRTIAQIDTFNPTNGYWIAAMAAIVGLLAVWPMLRGRKPPKHAASQAPSDSEIGQELSELLSEMSELTRRMSRELDDRSERLEELLHLADERIATLEANLGQGDVLGRSNVGRRGGEALGRNDDRGRDANQLGREGGGIHTVIAADARPDTRTPGVRGASETDPLHQQIYALHDAGRSPGQIAQSTNTPRGEVDLILALRTTR